jgi:hypothetical protein
MLSQDTMVRCLSSGTEAVEAQGLPLPGCIPLKRLRGTRRAGLKQPGVDILTAITKAQSVTTFDVIAQKIKILFGKEF